MEDVLALLQPFADQITIDVKTYDVVRPCLMLAAQAASRYALCQLELLPSSSTQKHGTLEPYLKVQEDVYPDI